MWWFSWTWIVIRQHLRSTKGRLRLIYLPINFYIHYYYYLHHRLKWRKFHSISSPKIKCTFIIIYWFNDQVNEVGELIIIKEKRSIQKILVFFLYIQFKQAYKRLVGSKFERCSGDTLCLLVFFLQFPTYVCKHN